MLDLPNEVTMTDEYGHSHLECEVCSYTAAACFCSVTGLSRAEIIKQIKKRLEIELGLQNVHIPG